MFTGHWLVADMDGTLTPTPSRARGRYLSLSHCMATGLGYGPRYRSCLPWLRCFLERGGSVCVVSTAGKRIWMQLYHDLAPAVFGLGALEDGGCSGGLSPASAACSTSEARANAAASAAPGTLYLCGFTGAAMFRTRPCQAVWTDMDRLYPDWRHQSSVTSNPSPSVADPTGPAVPPTAVGIEEWAEYRQQVIAVDVASGAAADAAAGAASTTTMDAAACAVAFEEGRSALVRFFEYASYVSKHNVTAATAFFAECLSAKYHAAFTALLQKLLDEARPALASSEEEGDVAPRLCFAKSRVLSRAALEASGVFLKETNDALVDVQRVPHADGTIAETAPIAQVVVMGIPMRYFDLIFPSASADLPPQWPCCAACAVAGAGAKARIEAVGLELKSQPNSVCLHRRDVDKGTCVRWLISEGNSGKAANGLSFDLQKSLAFGDVPESVDRPLTEFPPMQFISLAKDDVAADGRVGINAEAPQGSATCVHHVGGEEEGTALFLEELLTSCMKEAGEDRGDASCGGTWFTPGRVSACAARARARWKAVLAERSGADSPLSTL
ncbi:hypothetical protein ABL78_5824 [Leptomonas seymouri]|uniref:Uncharacterized protein n=1 Tax=Leptomonas seymouri TaxID=5684 RepID=A0A0N1I2Z9_LEPSE|nr:hypothetical protein ABL78_5824 [Leptomonas seymouri]|eukprot:KPI85131.1 hypothetical protein ABL78_5824 [Leptomonas seymouri]